MDTPHSSLFPRDARAEENKHKSQKWLNSDLAIMNVGIDDKLEYLKAEESSIQPAKKRCRLLSSKPTSTTSTESETITHFITISGSLLHNPFSTTNSYIAATKEASGFHTRASTLHYLPAPRPDSSLLDTLLAADRLAPAILAPAGPEQPILSSPSQPLPRPYLSSSSQPPRLPPLDPRLRLPFLPGRAGPGPPFAMPDFSPAGEGGGGGGGGDSPGPS